jgi:uncharacterized protein YidB (DUF937 family)
METLFKLVGRIPPSQRNQLMKAALGAVTARAAGGGGGGGLGGLLSQFQAEGLQDKADTWVGTGANARLRPAEVEQALGQDEVAEIAREAGVSERQARGGLAKMLPDLINQLTPDGQVPQDDAAMQAALTQLKARAGL